MRPPWMLAVAILLAVGQARAQESAPSAGYPEAPDPAIASASESSRLPPRSLLRSRLASWRPISRWLGRTSPSEDQDPLPTGAAANAGQRAAAGGPTPPLPAVNPPQDDAGTTPPTAGEPAAGAAAATAGGTAAQNRGSEPISANPAAVNIIAGTGALGRALGIDPESGVRLGGLWLGDTSGILSGGANQGKWALNSLTIVDLNLDGEKLVGWTGGSLGVQYLQFTGQNTNGLAGAFPGFDSIEAGPPFNRNELYQYWYRQSLFDDRLIFRIGQTVPTFDFNNVVRPVPVGDPAAAIPAVTALAFTPVFVNPTMLGVIPGYYNSAFGLTTTLAPTQSTYLNYGVYDGSGATANVSGGHQTGLSGPRFDGYYFHIGEVGYAYRLGPQRKPGNFGVGVWGQTGKLADLSVPHGTTNGAIGTYLFGAQRLWFRDPGVDNSGISGFYQFGANNSNALHARQYVGGGLTAFGLVPGRPDDSFGAGLNWTWLTQGDRSAFLFNSPSASASDLVPSLRPSQLMFQCYYQMKLVDGWFFQTNLTDIPNPGLPPLTNTHHTSFPNALAITLRLTVLF
jgi:porin